MSLSSRSLFQYFLSNVTRTKKSVSNYRVVSGEGSSPETDDNGGWTTAELHQFPRQSSGPGYRECDRLSRCIGIN